MSADLVAMRDRFRGFLPVVVDVETGGFNAATDALLEIAAALLVIDGNGRVVRGRTIREHVRPFEGGRLDPASLAVNGIDPWHPLRLASTESDALGVIFAEVRRQVREQQCTRAILVGHNASFDGRLYIAMELVLGESMQRRIPAGGMPPAEPVVGGACIGPFGLAAGAGQNMGG